jgi:hypothetical protein
MAQKFGAKTGFVRSVFSPIRNSSAPEFSTKKMNTIVEEFRLAMLAFPERKIDRCMNEPRPLFAPNNFSRANPKVRFASFAHPDRGMQGYMTARIDRNIPPRLHILEQQHL